MAISIDGPILAAIDRELQLLPAKAGLLAWADPLDYHITLRFLGGLSREQLTQLQLGQAKEGPTCPEFDLNLAGFQTFPATEKRRGVLWLGLAEQPPALITLQRALESFCQSYGHATEPKPFLPHLTLARFRLTDQALIEHFLSQSAEKSFGLFRVRSYALMRRRPAPTQGATAPVYEELWRSKPTGKMLSEV